MLYIMMLFIGQNQIPEKKPRVDCLLALSIHNLEPGDKGHWESSKTKTN